jgi:hypothetical protein
MDGHVLAMFFTNLNRSHLSSLKQSRFLMKTFPESRFRLRLTGIRCKFALNRVLRMRGSLLLKRQRQLHVRCVRCGTHMDPQPK